MSYGDDDLITAVEEDGNNWFLRYTFDEAGSVSPNEGNPNLLTGTPDVDANLIDGATRGVDNSLLIETTGSTISTEVAQLKSFGDIDPSKQQTWFIDVLPESNAAASQDAFTHYDGSSGVFMRIKPNGSMQFFYFNPGLLFCHVPNGTITFGVRHKIAFNIDADTGVVLCSVDGSPITVTYPTIPASLTLDTSFFRCMDLAIIGNMYEAGVLGGVLDQASLNTLTT